MNNPITPLRISVDT